MELAQQTAHLVAATVGFISLFLLWAAVVLGLILRNAWASTRFRHSTVLATHHTVALLGLTLGVVHTVVQLAAPLGHVRVIDEIVPFLNPVDPIGLGVGLVGLEIMIAAAASIAIQRRLGYSRWRALHALTYVAYMLVVGHVLLSGSDTSPNYVWGPVMLSFISVLGLWALSTPWLQSRWQSMARGSGQRPATDVTVGVDAVRCGRFGFCEHEAPEVFTLRNDGRLSYAATVPADQLDAVIRAMKVCPARAITVSHQPTIMMTSPPEPIADPPDIGVRDGGAAAPRGQRRSGAGRGRRSGPATTGGTHRGGGSAIRGDSW
jgi:sulfoxide reductase heme-binding subunit YedZ